MLCKNLFKAQSVDTKLPVPGWSSRPDQRVAVEKHELPMLVFTCSRPSFSLSSLISGTEQRILEAVEAYGLYGVVD